MTILGAAATPAMPETTKEEIKAKSAALNKIHAKWNVSAVRALQF